MNQLPAFFAALALAIPATGADQPAAAPRPPNLLVVMLDAVRADRLGCYGGPRPTTPTLDGLADAGVRFANAYASSSWTMPSLGTLFTGRHPREHGAVSHRHRLRPELPTLAGELAAAGYQTAAIVANPMASRKFGYAKGFDFYDDFSVFFGADLDLFGDGTSPAGVHALCTGATVSRLAIKWLRDKRQPDRPFFLFLLYFDPHADYVPPRHLAERFVDPAYAGPQDGRNIYAWRNRLGELAPADAQHLANLYDAEIRHTDDQLADLLAELAASQLADSTAVVVVSDHGEEFMEHGGLTHGATLFDELVRVPWLMRGPGLPAGRVFDPLVAHLDFLPTLLALAGLPSPASLPGRNLLPSLRGDAPPTPQPAFLDTEADGQSLVAIVAEDGRRKVVLRRTDGLAVGYDLAADPGERSPLAVDDGPFAALARRLREWEATLPAAAGNRPELDPKLLRQLKALGYAH